MKNLDRVQMLTAMGLFDASTRLEIFDPPWWRLDRWFWWFWTARRLRLARGTITLDVQGRPRRLRAFSVSEPTYVRQR